jgi:hypothetical protein
MNMKPEGTAGTGSVLGGYYLSFFFHFEATGLGPAVDGWTSVCNSLSMNLKLQGTANTGSALGLLPFEIVFSFLSHWIRPSSSLMGSCLQLFINEHEAPGHCRYRHCLG